MILLMEHWRSVLPEGAVLTVDYEDVVADLEGQTRRILAHCGLEWNDACLEFHKSHRQVRTASAGQVNQPLYKNAVGRGRNYQRFLAPLVKRARRAVAPGRLRDRMAARGGVKLAVTSQYLRGPSSRLAIDAEAGRGPASARRALQSRTA